MPRPRKCRKVCAMPGNAEFRPVGDSFVPADAVVMTVDEYESVRLIDYEGNTQEECAGHMKIARSTVQQIYFDARRKMSVSLVEGRPLRISGGQYRLCDGNEFYCGCDSCRRRRFGCGCARKAEASK